MISNECSKPKNLVNAWIEMRSIYKKQLKNSKYEYDKPIPYKKYLINSKQKNISLEESLGDLAPKVLK